MKRIAILGSTGSIGKSALDVVAKFPDRFRVVGLTAGRNTSLLAEQIAQFRPGVVAVPGEDACKELKARLQELKSQGADPEVRCGIEGLRSVAALPEADIVISAIVGAAGLIPTFAAIEAGKVVALANKETLVMAGGLAMAAAKRHGAVLFPVDSEHSAIFQCIHGYERDSVKRIILTASGGPFVGKTAEELEHVSAEDALKHPNWSMGKKITIDSATLMNKGLEVIEAHYLFGFSPGMIDVLVHPQSIIHSLVEFRDGSYIAQLSTPDMKGPISYALSYPERLPGVLEPVAWERLSGLTFRDPDHATFPCLSFAYSAIEEGGTLPAVLNASNEIAVKAFLDGDVGFNHIPVIIRKALDSHKPRPADALDAVLEADRQAREETRKIIKNAKWKVQK
ncbi:MAG TPA: 1-deoxy-D-xylulose-5-phosphate reductoisomerase [Dissulfurispiraceae bacterium]